MNKLRTTQNVSVKLLNINATISASRQTNHIIAQIKEKQGVKKKMTNVQKFVDTRSDRVLTGGLSPFLLK